jgi:hypothetical protein
MAHGGRTTPPWAGPKSAESTGYLKEVSSSVRSVKSERLALIIHPPSPKILRLEQKRQFILSYDIITSEASPQTGQRLPGWVGILGML